jgi:hypothetical protein
MNTNFASSHVELIPGYNPNWHWAVIGLLLLFVGGFVWKLTNKNKK